MTFNDCNRRADSIRECRRLTTAIAMSDEFVLAIARTSKKTCFIPKYFPRATLQVATPQSCHFSGRSVADCCFSVFYVTRSKFFCDEIGVAMQRFRKPPVFSRCLLLQLTHHVTTIIINSAAKCIRRMSYTTPLAMKGRLKEAFPKCVIAGHGLEQSWKKRKNSVLERAEMA